jgi:hypothetical protein
MRMLVYNDLSDLDTCLVYLESDKLMGRLRIVLACDPVLGFEL